MKESLGRIKEWVKKHPYLAGAILLGVVFLAYLAIKRGGGGGGSGGYDLGEPGEGPDEDTGLPLGLGGGGDTGLSAGGFQPVSEPSPEPVVSGGPFGGNGAAATEPVPSVVGPSYTIPETYPLAGGAGLSSPAMSFMVSDQTGQPATGQGAKVMPSKLETPQVKRAKQAVQARVTQTYKGPTAPPAGATENARKLSALNAPSEQKPDRPRTAPGATQTPAQRVGKSRYFTGYWQGIWYVLGYPRTMSSAGTIGTNTGAAKPTQAGSKKRAR